MVSGVTAGAGDGDAVDRRVDLAVPPRSRLCWSVRPELTGIGARPADAGELGVAGKAGGAGDLADELGRGQRPEPRLAEELRGELADELGDLGSSTLMAWVSSRSRRSSSRAIRTRIVCSARARRRPMRVLHLP